MNFEKPNFDNNKKKEEEKVSPENQVEQEKVLVQTISEEVDSLAEAEKPAKKGGKEMNKRQIARAKIMAIFAGITFFAAPATTQAGDLGRYIERGLGGAIQDVLRGPGRGTGRGLEKGMEKTVLNAFGIKTREQQREEQMFKREMERAAQNFEREVRRIESQEDREIQRIMDDYRKSKINAAKKDELMTHTNTYYGDKKRDARYRYDTRKDEIMAKYGVQPETPSTPDQNI